MKTNTTRRIIALFTASAALAAVVLTSGCLLVAAGAGAGAVAYVRGELKANVDASFDDTVNATSKALQQLSIAKVNEKRDGLVDVITARTAADKKVEIRLEKAARTLTTVRIRIGIVGDESLSMAILDKIKANL